MAEQAVSFYWSEAARIVHLAQGVQEPATKIQLLEIAARFQRLAREAEAKNSVRPKRRRPSSDSERQG